MSDIYLSYEISFDDSIDERMRKLYLGIISVGEDLYCKGAAVSELNKQITSLDNVVANMRRELEVLKKIRRKTK